MTTKSRAKEPKAVLEARAWKKKVSDLILDKGWEVFLRQSQATAARWAKGAGSRVKVTR